MNKSTHNITTCLPSNLITHCVDYVAVAVVVVVVIVVIVGGGGGGGGGGGDGDHIHDTASWNHYNQSHVERRRKKERK